MSIIEDVRYLYVNLTDAADEMRQGNTEFSLGVANGYDAAAEVLRVMLDKYDNYNDHEPLV